jgi:hypothetical protein
VTVLHVMDPGEWELEPGQEARFVDPESGEGVVAAPGALRRDYHDTVDRVVRAWRRACRGSGLDYHHVTTTTPFGHVLRRMARREARVAR